MNAAELTAHADRLGIPLRTVDDVREALEQARAQKSDAIMARLMLKHGRLTDEARAFVAAWTSGSQTMHAEYNITINGRPVAHLQRVKHGEPYVRFAEAGQSGYRYGERAAKGWLNTCSKYFQDVAMVEAK